MIAGVVLFAAAADEIVLHPGDPMTGFTRLLTALAFGLVLPAQAAVVRRVGVLVLAVALVVERGRGRLPLVEARDRMRVGGSPRELLGGSPS